MSFYQIIETGKLIYYRNAIVKLNDWILTGSGHGDDFLAITVHAVRDRFTYYSIEYESFTDMTSIQYELISIYQIQFLKLIKELQK